MARSKALPRPAAAEAWRTHPAGDLVCGFVNNLTLIGDYTGQTWTLEPWQESWIRELYGRRKPDGAREVNEVFLLLPRGSGKTQQAAGVCLAQLCLGPPGQEIYAASSDEDKAGRVYTAMAQMVRADPDLDAQLECTDSLLMIRNPATNSVFQALASDSDQGHSLAPSMLVLDELHLWRSTKLYDALKTGMGKRRGGNRLIIEISTAGDRKHGLCWELYCYAKKVLSGEVTDPSFLPVIWEAAEDDDWTSPATWAKAHPAYGTFLEHEFLAEECAKARQMPWRETAFRQLYLNQWVEVSAETWIDPASWRACEDAYTAEDLDGADCFAALDLSSVRDLTSISLFFPESGRALSWSWLASEGLKEREDKDGAFYFAWHRAGRLKLCTGGRIVHAEVARDVNEVLQRFNVVRLVADPYSLHLIAPLLNQEVERYPQNPAHMSPPAKWLETAVAERKFRHDGDPLLAWCAGNTVIEKDKYENISPCKGKSRKRIDPVVALVMAIGAWLGGEADAEPDINDFYSDRSNYLID